MDQEQIKTLFADFGLECYKAYTDNNLRIPDSLQEKYDAIYNHEMAEATGIAVGEEMFCLDPDTYPFRMVKVIVKVETQVILHLKLIRVRFGLTVRRFIEKS